jgi:hypothetical protein
VTAAKLNLFIFLLFAASISACELRGNAQKKHITLESQKQGAPDKEEKVWLDYWPAVVELEGNLRIKTLFGPPNFGENPETDSKERSWIMSLSRPISVRGKADSDLGLDSVVEDVRELQLVLRKPRKDLIGKKVIVKGTLFHAHTGHHHTEVLMDVQSIRRSP